MKTLKQFFRKWQAFKQLFLVISGIFQTKFIPSRQRHTKNLTDFSWIKNFM